MCADTEFPLHNSRADQLAVRELRPRGLSETDVGLFLPPMRSIASQQQLSVTSASEAAMGGYGRSGLRARFSRGCEESGITRLPSSEQHKTTLIQSRAWNTTAGEWQQLTNYFGRAQLLGLDTQAGRQALAKFVATGCGLFGERGSRLRNVASTWSTERRGNDVC